MAKSTSLGNLKDFAFGAAASSPSRGAGADDDDDDDSWHWSRWLFSSRLPRSYALLAHGFDVAVVAELAKVESLYDRELQARRPGRRRGRGAGVRGRIAAAPRPRVVG